jgi:hypothetical protein
MSLDLSGRKFERVGGMSGGVRLGKLRDCLALGWFEFIISMRCCYTGFL